MATELITLTSQNWTKLSTAGQSGTCWKRSHNTVLIDHTDQETDSTLPLANTNVAKDKAKRVPLDADDSQVLSIMADGEDDIFYAISASAAVAEIVVDLIS